MMDTSISVCASISICSPGAPQPTPKAALMLFGAAHDHIVEAQAKVRASVSNNKLMYISTAIFGNNHAN